MLTERIIRQQYRFNTIPNEKIGPGENATKNRTRGSEGWRVYRSRWGSVRQWPAGWKPREREDEQGNPGDLAAAQNKPLGILFKIVEQAPQ